MKIPCIVAPMTLGLLLQGCAAAAIGVTLATAGAGAGMTAGVEHTLNGIVYKTFASPANEVRFATLKTLDRMGMPLTDDQKTDTGWKVYDVVIDGASLVTTYRGSFNDQIQKGGIDSLLKTLQERNASPTPARPETPRK